MVEPAGSRCRIGVDVGGTFTDFVLADLAQGRLIFYKEPSTPADPSLAVERGIQAVLRRADAAAGDIELVVHGTTLGLNAIIQRKGAATALVVSRGNRDVLELARSKMPSAYDFSVGKEEPLVPRDLVFEIDARIGPDGTVLARPGAGQLAEVGEALQRREVVAVAVMLVNSYVDPSLEAEVAESLSERLSGVLVTRSAGVWPEIREYERASIATMNAYVHPLLESYFSRLQSRLAGIGVEGSLYITASNGGTLSVETARERPVDTLLSGPASGVVAATKLAAQASRKGIISIDMGGTSCDMAVSQGSEPEYTTRTHIGDFPLVAPVVNVSTIGAGGGSVVWVDNLGILKVGPESAGADPGPV
jgi:N-methylhydantoinase A